MLFILFLFLLQGTLIFFDEFYFHYRRGLGRWERIGHPVDTFSVMACIAWLLFAESTTSSQIIYLGLAAFSCLLVTKDEFVHNKLCGAGEQWLHAMLFLMHPIVLGAAALIKWHPSFQSSYLTLKMQLSVMTLFCVYQIVYWNFLNEKSTAEARQ